MLDKAIVLQQRSKKFAVEVVKYYKHLPKTDEARIIGKQLLRSSTSVAANYRAVCRARSLADFISKMGIVVEETDESLLWFEILNEAKIIPKDSAEHLMKESDELLRIFSSSLSTAKANNQIKKSQNLKISKSKSR